jgi:hypothetical protein
MNGRHRKNQVTDEALLEALGRLRTVPTRDRGRSSFTRARFLTEIAAAQRGGLPAPHQSLWARVSQDLSMATPRFRRSLTVCAVAMFLAATLLSGTGITAATASRALPGDTLYPIKMSVEKTRIGLTGEAPAKVRLSLGYADRRLHEMQDLIAAGRSGEITVAAREYEEHVHQALAALDSMSAADQNAAQALAAEISASLADYALALAGISTALPESERIPIDEAIEYSRAAETFTGAFRFKGTVDLISDDSWVISGQAFRITEASVLDASIAIGSVVIVEAWANADGTFYLWRAVPVSDPAGGEDTSGSASDVQDADLRFGGTVQSISDEQWVVGDRALRITPETRIGEGIHVGDLVTLQAYSRMDGTLYLIEIDFQDNAHVDVPDDTGDADSDAGDDADDAGDSDSDAGDAAADAAEDDLEDALDEDDED